jgi:hypothetical protein
LDGYATGTVGARGAGGNKTSAAKVIDLTNFPVKHEIIQTKLSKFGMHTT